MKKVLIICYYWPPAGGPGVQRWLKFVTYLRNFGIEPIVYVPENPTYPIIDNAIQSEVPESVTILKHPVKEPYKFAKYLSRKKTQQISSGIISKKQPSFLEKMLLFIRGNFFIPDARIGWVKPSVQYLSGYLKKQNVDCIITSGPPHSLHLIGLQLQKTAKLPWVADFRDPWTTIHYHKSLRLTNVSEKKHKRLESLVLNKADHILVTSPTTRLEFTKLTEKPISLITNGYEPLEGISAVLDASFSIAHIGSLLTERNPMLFWEVLSEIGGTNTQFAADLQITLAGAVSDEILKSIASFGLTKNMVMKGYVSHKEAIQLQHNAQVLLLLEIDSEETKAIIPGKLFEYLHAKRPIIAIGPKGSDIKEIIDTTESGSYFQSNEKDALKKHILSLYDMYSQGKLEVSSQNIEAYSRKALTSKLANVLLHKLVN